MKKKKLIEKLYSSAYEVAREVALEFDYINQQDNPTDKCPLNYIKANKEFNFDLLFENILEGDNDNWVELPEGKWQYILKNKTL